MERKQMVGVGAWCRLTFSCYREDWNPQLPDNSITIAPSWSYWLFSPFVFSFSHFVSSELRKSFQTGNVFFFSQSICWWNRNKSMNRVSLTLIAILYSSSSNFKTCNFTKVDLLPNIEWQFQANWMSVKWSTFVPTIRIVRFCFLMGSFFA